MGENVFPPAFLTTHDEFESLNPLISGELWWAQPYLAIFPIRTQRALQRRKEVLFTKSGKMLLSMRLNMCVHFHNFNILAFLQNVVFNPDFLSHLTEQRKNISLENEERETSS